MAGWVCLIIVLLIIGLIVEFFQWLYEASLVAFIIVLSIFLLIVIGIIGFIVFVCVSASLDASTTQSGTNTPAKPAPVTAQKAPPQNYSTKPAQAATPAHPQMPVPSTTHEHPETEDAEECGLQVADNAPTTGKAGRAGL